MMTHAHPGFGSPAPDRRLGGGIDRPELANRRTASLRHFDGTRSRTVQALNRRAALTDVDEAADHVWYRNQQINRSDQVPNPCSPEHHGYCHDGQKCKEERTPPPVSLGRRKGGIAHPSQPAPLSGGTVSAQTQVVHHPNPDAVNFCHKKSCT